jgi:recombination protein RecA
VRIDLRRVETLKHSGTVIGNRVRAKVVKNKLAPPFRTAEFDIIFHGPQIGISRQGDVLDLAVDAEIVKKQGSFYSFEDRKLGQGREQAKAYLRENPQLVEELENLIRAAHAPPEPVAASAAKNQLRATN